MLVQSWVVACLGPVDPCAVLNGGCAEQCRNESGVAACACGPGRALQADGRACAPPRACGPGRWACAEGPCVPDELVCDGVPHCSDAATASDEDLYYCSESTLQLVVIAWQTPINPVFYKS